MVSSINNSDINRVKAEAFVNKSDKNLNKIANRINNIKYHKEHKRAGEIANFATKSIPLIAAASAFAITKSPKAAVKQGAVWGALIGIPAIVSKANNNIKRATATPENKKGHGLSFGGELVATLAGFWGANAGINKLAKNEKVNQLADTAINKSKEIFESVSSKIKMPKKVAQKASSLAEEAKSFVPKNVKTFVNNTIESAKNSEALQKLATKSVKVGKKALKYAPEIALGSVIVGTLGYGIKEGMKVSNTKKQLKDDQLKTAKVLISSYKAENEDLKAQLAQKAE